jgi:hypothetical protein
MKSSFWRVRVMLGAAVAALLLFFCFPAQNSPAPPPTAENPAAKQRAMARFLGAEIPFEANTGQTDAAAKFVARGLGYTVFLTDESVLMRLAHPKKKNRDNVLEMKLVGAKRATISGSDPLPSRSHYFQGSSAKAWRRNVPHFGKVVYSGVYPNTDLVFYGHQGELEYDVVLGPGADPRRVVLEFSGAQKLRVNGNGDLILAFDSGPEIVQRRPKIYQRLGNERKEIRGSYQLMASNRVRFDVGEYDKGAPLVIDPVLSYATYLGGSSGGIDYATSIALDAAGNAYIAGLTNSVGFPIGSAAPAQPERAGGHDVFIAKIRADGGALLYSTYLGGTSDDFAYGIAVDPAGAAYVTGTTLSLDFPATPGAYRTSSTGQMVFAAKLNAAGSSLVYATYLGNGVGAGIAVDSAGFAYVTGSAYCCAFPTTAGAYQRVQVSADAFVTKINQTGSGLV